jgi:hypothetical protein
MQSHPAALLRRIATVGACDDVFIESFRGVGDSPVQVGIRPEFFDDVDLHLDTEPAQLEVLRADPDHDLAGAIGYPSR